MIIQVFLQKNAVYIFFKTLKFLSVRINQVWIPFYIHSKKNSQVITLMEWNFKIREMWWDLGQPSAEGACHIKICVLKSGAALAWSGLQQDISGISNGWLGRAIHPSTSHSP